jgi:hypothetical protein
MALNIFRDAALTMRGKYTCGGESAGRAFVDNIKVTTFKSSLSKQDVDSGLQGRFLRPLP